MEIDELKKIIIKNEEIYKELDKKFQIILIEDKINQVFQISNTNNIIYAKVSRRGWSKYEWNSLKSLHKKGYYVPKPIHYIPLDTPISTGWSFGNLIQENGIIFYYPITGKSLMKSYSLDKLISVLNLLYKFHKENIKTSSPIKEYQEFEVKRGLKYLKDLKMSNNIKLVRTIKNYEKLRIDFGLIHGDARPEHFIFHNNKIGMIDLEGTCIGDPFKDFAILLAELYFYGYEINLTDYSMINKLFGRELADNEVLRLNFFLIRRILVKMKYSKLVRSKEDIIKTLKALCDYGNKLLDKEEQKVLILDTSAFLGGYNPNIITIKQQTIPEVFDEVKTPSVKSILDFSVETGKLQLYSPSSQFIKEVKNISEKSGDSFVLSEVDIKILALALEVQRKKGFIPTLITDDYAMQNIAGKLNIKFKPILEKEISDLIKWKIYCPGCKESFNNIPKTKICPNCGTNLKRFSSKKTKI
ncbi:MAG: phosphotransferase [Candidatus Helarchaeota archaeon]|nr:phosphotransferase [Candidatus Helarchaeota archaeon]